MILLRANPLEDIGNIAKITFVMLDGEVVTPGVY
jgi:hypothetical protein